MIPTSIIIIGVIVCLIGSAFFAGAETVVTSADRAALHREARRRERHALLVRRVLQKIEVFLGTTLVGTNLMHVAGTTLAAYLVHRHIGGRWESVINTLIMTPLILVVGELTPKAIGRTHADRLVLVLARPLQIAEYALYPLVVFSNGVASFLARLVGGKPGGHHSRQVTREDIEAIAELAGEEGVLPDTAVMMLQTVFELGNRPVSSIMVPLVDVLAVDEQATVRELQALAEQSGHTRFPVFQKRIDDVVGIVDLRYVLYGAGFEDQLSTSADHGNEHITPHVQRDVVFVPESKSVGELLYELHYHKIPMAVAVDEHGGVVGIVTTEDLVEEIVGEIQDERDLEQREMRQVGESVYDCDGKLEARELAEHLKLKIDVQGFETVAGLILKLAGHIPEVGERLFLDGFEIEVLEVIKRRVSKVRFRRLHSTKIG